ncbi:MAG: DNA polymerase, partial [Shewanella sp.]|nr:DNA polymerase [Shewanella sp.]
FASQKINVFGHNVKFDKRWMEMKLDTTFRIYDDTIMMAALLDENSPSNQDDLTKRYVPEMAGYADAFNQGIDKSRLDLVPFEKLMQYGGGDVVANFRLRENMAELLAKDPKAEHLYRTVSIPALNMFSGVDRQGLKMNMEAFGTFREMMREKVVTQRESLLNQVPKSIRRDHVDKGLEFSRPAFVSDILFNHKDGFRLTPKVFTKSTKGLDAHLRVPSTSGKDHLPFFFDECPFTEELAQYQKDFQLYNNNIIKFEENFMVDGMVYPQYHLHKAVTGRTSSSDPNGQNIPKRGKYAKAYRRAFIPASEEYVIMEADLSQAELRIAADMANEREMIKIYREDGDIHRATGIIVSGLTEEEFNALPKAQQKDYRQKAKAVNFGFLYGMGWRTFITYAKTDYGVTFTEEEAQNIRNRYFSKYSRLQVWHKSMREYAHRHGFVRSYSGRVRHLPQINSHEDYIRGDAERQAINSPVQEFSSTLGVIAMTRMSEEIDPYVMRPLAFVHDAIFVLVRKEYVDWGARTLKWYMESNDLEAMFGIKLKLPIKADVAVGDNLGDQFELDGLEIDTPYDFVKARLEDQKYINQAARDKGERPTRSKFPILGKQKTPPNNGQRVGYEFTGRAA